VRQQLPDPQAEYFIPCRLQFFLQLWNTRLILMVFEQSLYSSLNEGLLETASMILLLAVLEGLAFLLPVELKVYVPSCGSDGVVLVYQFHN